VRSSHDESSRKVAVVSTTRRPPRQARTRSTTSRERERPGGHPVFHCIGAVSAVQKLSSRSVAGRRTDFYTRWLLCALLRASVIASAAGRGAGDDIRCRIPQRRLVSRAAVAGALALEGVSAGERLVAFVLASYANREHRAWPGAPTAAARAGLSRSRYQEAREQLVRRGLVVVEERATGRGRSSTVSLAFAATGPWWDGDVNVDLFEAVLGRSRASGPARLLLATMAALADEQGIVRNLSTEQLCAAAGVTDRTYRRARQALLGSGELILRDGTGGRGNTNVWGVVDPGRADGAAPLRTPRRIPPPVGARPLVGSARPAEDAVPGAWQDAVAGVKGGQDRTLSDEKCPARTGVSSIKGGQDRTLSDEKCPIRTGVSVPKGGQDRTLFELSPLETPAETPAKTPAETPAPCVRAGREPSNPRTREHPPSPPAGGSSADSMIVEETYITERGRNRRRAVRVDLDAVRRGLGLPGVADREDWARIRRLLFDAVGENQFEIWLEPLELIAIDGSEALVIAAPAVTGSWVRGRFGGLLARCSQRESRELRLADEPERRALDCEDGRPAPGARAIHINQKEVS